MRRLASMPLLVAAALTGCLRDNDEFVERADLWEDCTASLDACKVGLECFQAKAIFGQPPGYVCIPGDCDSDADCPQPDSGTARPMCQETSSQCRLNCSPRPCSNMTSICNACPPGHESECAETCGPPASHCFVCPDGMDCIPVGQGESGEVSFTCAFR